MSGGDENVPIRRLGGLTSWKKDAAKPAAYKRAPNQEKETAKRLTGARPIPASGSRFRKADVEVPGLARVECKATQAKSFSVTRGMLNIVEDAAMLNGQVPYVEIEFVNAKGAVDESYCVLPRSALEALLNRVADAEGITVTDRRSFTGAERYRSRNAKK